MRDILADIASILRIHIILIAMMAALVFGWLFSGTYVWGVALLGGLDWLLINLQRQRCHARGVVIERLSRLLNLLR